MGVFGWKITVFVGGPIFSKVGKTPFSINEKGKPVP